jgi:hypothetical protein
MSHGSQLKPLSPVTGSVREGLFFNIQKTLLQLEEAMQFCCVSRCAAVTLAALTHRVSARVPGEDAAGEVGDIGESH